MSIRLSSSLTRRSIAALIASTANPGPKSALRPASRLLPRPGLVALLFCCLPLFLHAASSPVITSPAAGSVLSGSSATFTWSTESGVSQYQLWLGSSANSYNIGTFSQGSTTAGSLSVTATGLPTAGATLYATLYYDLNGSWGSVSTTYKEASAGAQKSPAPSSLSCATSSFTGAASDSCTVTLAAVAPSGGTAVTLASNNSAVTVPSSVTVAASSTSATFSATIAAVSTTQTATLTASAGSVSKTAALTLNAGTPALTLSASSVAFGSVQTNTAATRAVTITSSGTAPVTISALSASGSGFSASGISAPLTLTAGQTATLNVQFDPTAAGAASGQVALTTNCTSGGTRTIALSGTGMTASTPVLTGPAPGSVLPGSSATFTWTTESGISEYQLWLGSSANSYNLGTFTQGSATTSTMSVTASGLPTSGATLYATLYYNLNGSWGSVSSTYTEASGSSAALSALSCTSTSLTGAVSDACTVSLSAAAPTGGISVSLASSNSTVTVPASVSIAAGATSASFTATAKAVTTTQTATLTATAATVSKTVALQLNPSTSALSISSASVGFGSVQLNTPATQSVTLTSSGTASVSISSISLTGTGFSASGVSTPLSLAAGQSATLNLQFDPTSGGSFSGQVTITSNAASGATQTIALSGTGSSASNSVDLTWDAPSSSSDPVTGYNIYRAAANSSTYQLLNSSLNSSTAYTDTTVQVSQNYTYIVTSVDSSGIESLPSNSIELNIP